MTDEVATVLPPALVDALVARLGHTEAPPTDLHRPAQVIYGGAQLFSAASAAKLGERARVAMETWGADDAAFGRTVGVTDAPLAREVAARVRDKLAKSPIEAMCIDFEDGYGPRSNEEEDAEATRTATELAKMPDDGVLVGIRIKALSGATVARAVRTLDRFVTTFARASDGAMRPGFTVTLPKIAQPAEVSALVDLLEALEARLSIDPIAVELMIESPGALLDHHGGVAAPSLVAASRGRAIAVHLGAYDLVAQLDVTAGDQRLDHPYCDVARMLLKLSLGGTGIGISDGATTLLPIPPKSASPRDAAAAVHRAWALHARNVTRAIDLGIWQGWDLHPVQLPARYGALFAYFLERRAELATRLRRFVESATQATRVGQVFDDAATGQGLLGFFLRGYACGALDGDDLGATTLTFEELVARSFADIASARAAQNV